MIMIVCVQSKSRQLFRRREKKIPRRKKELRSEKKEIKSWMRKRGNEEIKRAEHDLADKKSDSWS